MQKTFTFHRNVFSFFSPVKKKMPVNLTKFVSLFLILNLFLVLQAAAATITVSSISELQTAINNAAPGDIIILANGVYTTTADITVSKKGTAAQPITIASQTIGGAEITGRGGFSILSPASYIIIKGFIFTHIASHAKMASGTSFCRWTRNIFETPGEGENLLLNGNDHEVDYNTFQNKNALGRFIAVRGSGSQIAQRLWIHHNYFVNQLRANGNGGETLQFGLSGYSLSSSNSIVEHNLFEKCDGENELISVKASAVTVRYNTIRNCPAQFTLRHGNRCQVYGNYFINTPGLRIFGDDHVIYSNHFENCNPALDIGNGDGEVADGAPLTSHDRPDRVLIAFNTLVNNPVNFKQGGRSGGLGATYITVANNIVQGGGAAASIAGPYTNAQWLGNILFNVTGPGAMPASGYTVVDPKIARDVTGTFHLQEGSPAANAVTEAYPSVSFDMDGQPRTTPMEIGADEISNSPATAHILATTDVGHAATAAGIPSVTITSPSDKSVLDGGRTVSITADAVSFDGSIAKVEFYVDGTKVGDDVSKPYATDWLATEGTHNLTAKAIDNNDRESSPSSVVVSVNPEGSRVKITSPASAASFVAPASITIDATATDSLNTVSKVEFFNGTTKLGEDLSSPYSFTWSNVAKGNYVLQAKATNSLGKLITSSPVNISVTAPVSASFDITDNGGTISGQYPNTTKPSEDVPSIIDNSKTTKYFRSGRTALWVQYKSTTPAVVVKYTLTSANDVPERDPRDWTLQASNNGSSWITLDTRSGETFASRFLTKTYTINNSTAYTYYRLNITNNNGNTGTQFAEWELFERRNQVITFNEIGDQVYGADPIGLSATSTSGLPVSFEVVSGPATIDEDGLLTITGADSIVVRAHQAGNENFFPASANQSFVVYKADQAIAFEAVENKTYGDAPFNLSASSDVGLPISFEVLSGPVTISGATLTIEGAGTAVVRAYSAGNENYNPASAEQTFTINKAAQNISFLAIPPTNKTSTVQLTAASSSGLPVSYSVVSGPGAVTGTTLSFGGEGEVSVQASQGGDENYLAAASVNQIVLVYGDDEKKDGIKIKVYPNPTAGQLRVKLDNKKDKDYSFIIFNGQGIAVQSTVLQKNSKQYEVDFNLDNAQNGFYYLHVSDGTEKIVRTIIKQ